MIKRPVMVAHSETDRKIMSWTRKAVIYAAFVSTALYAVIGYSLSKADSVTKHDDHIAYHFNERGSQKSYTQNVQTTAGVSSHTWSLLITLAVGGYMGAHRVELKRRDDKTPAP